MAGKMDRVGPRQLLEINNKKLLFLRGSMAAIGLCVKFKGDTACVEPERREYGNGDGRFSKWE